MTDTPSKTGCTILHRFDGMYEIPSRFGEVFHKAEKSSFDLGLGWFKHLEQFGMDKSGGILVYAMEDEIKGQPSVVLPLCYDSKQKNLTSLSNYYTSLYYPLINSGCDKTCLSRFFSMVRADMRWRSLSLSPLPADMPIYEMTYESLREAGWKAFRYFAFGNWYLPLEGRGYADYFDGLPSNLKNTIERKRKKFFHCSGSLEIVTGGARLEQAIADYEKIYTLSWKRPEPFPEFISGLMRLYAEQGALRMGLAYINEEPAAAQIWIVTHGRAAIYKLAYDKRFSSFSVGTILTDHLMRQVIDVDQVEEVDYLIGDDPYKQQWMTQRRERWGIVAYNPEVMGGRIGALNELFRKKGKSIIHRLTRYKKLLKG